MAILEDLGDLANNSRRTTFLKSLAEPNSPLNKCESALEKLDALSNKWTDSKNLLQLLKRPQLKESLLSILKDIGNQKATLILALAVENVKNSRELNDTVTGLCEL